MSFGSWIRILTVGIFVKNIISRKSELLSLLSLSSFPLQCSVKGTTICKVKCERKIPGNHSSEVFPSYPTKDTLTCTYTCTHMHTHVHSAVTHYTRAHIGHIHTHRHHTNMHTYAHTRCPPLYIHTQRDHMLMYTLTCKHTHTHAHTHMLPPTQSTIL